MKKNIYYCDVCLCETADHKKIYLTDEETGRVKHFCLSCYVEFLDIFNKYGQKTSRIKQPKKEKNINRPNTTPLNSDGETA